MKLVEVIILALLVLNSGGNVFADNYRQEGIHSRERADRPSQSGAIHENSAPQIADVQKHREFPDHEVPHEHGGDHDHDKFPHHHHSIIKAPIIVVPGYYNYQLPVYSEQAPEYVEQDGSYYWYYCPDMGYYPNVQTCPNGWLKVVPSSP